MDEGVPDGVERDDTTAGAEYAEAGAEYAEAAGVRVR